MQLTEEQWLTLLERLAERSTGNWEELSQVERGVLMAQLATALAPPLAKLPEGLAPSDLVRFQGFLRGEAISLLVARLRKTLIYRDASESTILGVFTEAELEEATRQLSLLVGAALELLPTPLPVDEEELAAVDWDAELADLLRREGGGSAQ